MVRFEGDGELFIKQGMQNCEDAESKLPQFGNHRNSRPIDRISVSAVRFEIEDERSLRKIGCDDLHQHLKILNPFQSSQ
jgi:hypothetical protein